MSAADEGFGPGTPRPAARWPLAVSQATADASMDDVAGAALVREARLDKSEQVEVAIPDASRAFRRIYETYFAKRGLTLTQALIVGNLDVTASHTMNQTELSRMLNLRKAATGTAIDLLVARGVLTRSTDPNDGRAKLVSLTPEGVELAEEVDQGFGELAAALRRNTTAAQRRALVATLDVMRANLESFADQNLGWEHENVS